MIHALSHEDPTVRLAAVEVLDSIRENGAIPALVHALGDADAKVRKQVCRALGNMGPEARAAAPALMPLFSDKDDAVRSQAAWAFWTLKEEAQQVVPVFMETVKARDMNTFRTSIWTLAKIGPGALAAIPVLREMLQDKSCYRRLEAANALNEIEQDLGLLLPELMRALKCPCSDCRSAAPGIRERLGARTSAMVRDLIVDLKDGDTRTRERAARALGMIGPQARAAAGALREALKDPEPSVRNVATEALKKIQVFH
jgi:HEAT repeat protein